MDPWYGDSEPKWPLPPYLGNIPGVPGSDLGDHRRRDPCGAGAGAGMQAAHGFRHPAPPALELYGQPYGSDVWEPPLSALGHEAAARASRRRPRPGASALDMAGLPPMDLLAGPLPDAWPFGGPRFSDPGVLPPRYAPPLPAPVGWPKPPVVTTERNGREAQPSGLRALAARPRKPKRVKRAKRGTSEAGEEKEKEENDEFDPDRDLAEEIKRLVPDEKLDSDLLQLLCKDPIVRETIEADPSVEHVKFTIKDQTRLYLKKRKMREARRKSASRSRKELDDIVGKMRQQNTMLQRTFEISSMLPIASLLIEHSGIVAIASASCASIIGMQSYEMVDRDVADVFGADNVVKRSRLSRARGHWQPCHLMTSSPS
uniref:PAS domain-containing protein n=1 Tax=Phaeomonas parva TaxID=124430 RepID=A0A7S1UF65_9STRA|mmetsp:Transcript_45058/g.141129  ORF Transcript_45058/g.141129 Transcript_45058/m.141129 type:complete len:372 (+) Transcript_45058:351-1466(+)